MRTIAPLAIVQTDDADASAIQRGEPWVPYAQETKDLSFALWSTICGGDAAATERLVKQELDEGAAVPTRQTIARWAREEGWAALREDGWRNVAGRTLYDLQRSMLNNIILAQKIKRDAMTGAYAETPQDGAIRLKAAELADRLIERGVVPLAVPKPPEDATDERQLTRAEREARASERLARRWQERS